MIAPLLTLICDSRVGVTLGNLYGPGSGRIWTVVCGGQESSLDECQHVVKEGVHHCGHSDDVSIACIYVSTTTTTATRGGTIGTAATTDF